MGKNILVTGSDGQLGSELRKICELHSTDTFYFTNRNSLDITSEQKVFNYFFENKIDVVLNCAAYTAVDKAETAISLAEFVNYKAVEHLANACKNYDAQLLHISTDYVFDGKGFSPYSPDSRVSPVNAYGVSKLKGEEAVKKISPKNSAIIRTSWVYSSYGNNFLKTMLHLGREKDSLKVVDDQIGSPTNAKDLAEVLLLLIPKLNSEKVQLFHYTNEGVCSWYDFATAIMEISGLNCNIIPIPTEEYPTTAKRPSYSVMSKREIKMFLDIKIPHWRTSLKKCVFTLNEMN